MHFSGGIESFSDILGVLGRVVPAIIRSVGVFEDVYLQMVVSPLFLGNFPDFLYFFLDFYGKVVLYCIYDIS